MFLASLSLKPAWTIPPTFFMDLGVSRPTADSVLSVFQGSVNKRMSTPRRKGHLLPSGDLDFTWEPGRWPRASLLSEVWVRSQNSSLRTGLGPCPQGWLGHAAGPKAPCVHLKAETLPEKWKVELGSRKNSGPGTRVKRVWLYVLSCETVTNIIWQEIGTCVTVSPNRCLTWRLIIFLFFLFLSSLFLLFLFGCFLLSLLSFLHSSSHLWVQAGPMQSTSHTVSLISRNSPKKQESLFLFHTWGNRGFGRWQVY